MAGAGAGAGMTRASRALRYTKEDGWQDRAAGWIARAYFSALDRLPFARRVTLSGWIFAHPLARFGHRLAISRANLALVFPDMPEDGREAIARGGLDNFGRTFAEIFSSSEFAERHRLRPLSGPGLSDLVAAYEAGRPLVLATGHIGNIWSIVVALRARGVDTAVVYRPTGKRPFDKVYVAHLKALGGKAYPRTRPGMRQMVRHLKAGGALVMLIDQFTHGGALLDFLGHPARTTLTAAELALKFDAPMFPIYGLRKDDGLNFDHVVGRPIAPATPEAMTQAFNDDLAEKVRAHPEQWMWMHRRWKDVPGLYG